MMQYSLKFDLTSGHDAQSLIALLSDRYVIKKGQSKSAKLIFYDTFDWRLFKKSLILYKSGKKLYLNKLSDNESLFSLQATPMPVFLWDFPENRLKEYLAPIIEMRALLKIVGLQSRATSYSILNSDEKTVVRLIHEEIRYPNEKDEPILSNHLLLMPIKGYQEYASGIAGQLDELGITRGKENDTFLKGVAASGKKVGSYSSKLDIQLDPVMRSDEAVKIILRFLFLIIRINESYIEEDIDTEFVHDFRVAIRRTRSALGQLKHVFSEEITDRFKKDFSYLGKLSNALRDLDVYLLKEDDYKAKIPSVLRDDIGPMFDYLRKKREEAFKGFVNGLKSKQYMKIIKDWETFINKPQQEHLDASNAGIPIIDLARKRIYNKYQNVVKVGNDVLKNEDERMLHVLRIHCKKLRYLMEFFSSLFIRKKMDRGIRLLKKLQDNLGDINDLRVHEQYLLEISKELPVTQVKKNKTFIAIGILIGALEREREMVKRAFAETFIDFASPENRRLFRKLFI